MPKPYVSTTEGYPTEVVQEVTEDFVESFKDQQEFSGGFFHIVYSSRILPDGVDLNRPEIQNILQRLDEWKTANPQ